MSAEPPEWIREVLSAPRFAPYLTAADGDVDVAIRLYSTGGTSKSRRPFYTPLHCLELGLRNAMHAQLCEYFGSEDWWTTAELPFGFWVSLVSRGAAYDRTLWVPALHRAFPFYKGKRQLLHDHLQAMVLFRNRIMHYEPVHHRDLRADHAKIYRLLGYVSPRMVKELETLDWVPEVLDRRVGGQWLRS